MTSIPYELQGAPAAAAAAARLARRARRLLGPGLAFAATLVFLVLFLREGSLGEAWSAAAGLPADAIALALVSVGLATAAAAVRWRSLLAAAGVTVPLPRLFSGVAVGAAANNALPARGGDLVRLEAARRAAPIPGFAVAGTLIAERLLDGFAIALWLVLGALLAGATVLLPLGLAILGGSAIALLLAVLAATAPARAGRAASSIGAVLPRRLRGRAARAGAGLLDGLAVFRSPRRLGEALAASLALRAADVVLYAAIAKGLGVGLGLGDTILLEGIGSLALSVPATAAGIGTFDYLTLVGARSVGLEGPSATAYVLTVHAFVVLPVTLLGAALVPWALRRRAGAPATA